MPLIYITKRLLCKSKINNHKIKIMILDKALTPEFLDQLITSIINNSVMCVDLYTKQLSHLSLSLSLSLFHFLILEQA